MLRLLKTQGEFMIKKLFLLILTIVMATLSFSSQAKTSNNKKTDNINMKLEKTCTKLNGNVAFNEKGMVICKITDIDALNKKHLKEIYSNELKSPTLFIAWDIKDKKNKSFTLNNSNSMEKQTTLNINNYNIDIYSYYSNIINLKNKTVSIKQADNKTLNSIIKKTKNIINQHN